MSAWQNGVQKLVRYPVPGKCIDYRIFFVLRPPFGVHISSRPTAQLPVYDTYRNPCTCHTLRTAKSSPDIHEKYTLQPDSWSNFILRPFLMML